MASTLYPLLRTGVLHYRIFAVYRCVFMTPKVNAVFHPVSAHVIFASKAFKMQIIFGMDVDVGRRYIILYLIRVSKPTYLMNIIVQPFCPDLPAGKLVYHWSSITATKHIICYIYSNQSWVQH